MTANAFSSVWGANAIWGTGTQTAAEATGVAINGEKQEADVEGG